MQSGFQSFILLLVTSISTYGQIHVATVVDDVKASGGLTMAPNGNLIISDFGKALNTKEEETSIYEFNLESGKLTLYGDGFTGASGAAFDSDGNFYQSNPRGHRISRRNKNGIWVRDWVNYGLNTPIGVAADADGYIYVCNCGANNIVRINTTTTDSDTFATSPDFNCPNGLTRDYFGNLFACNFNDGKVLKINRWGEVEVWAELPTLNGGPSPVGSGHLIWANGNLIVATIGTGEIYLINGKNIVHKICGLTAALNNTDGDCEQATFTKPNGVAASGSGDTLFVNCSTPSWANAPMDLHPTPLRVLQGVCQLEYSNCWSTEDKKAVELIMQNTKLFSLAYTEKNYDDMVAAYTVDGMIMPNGSKIISGKEHIRKRWVLPEGSRILRHQVYHEEIRVLGDHAYDYGYYDGATVSKEGKVEKWKGKYVIIWRKVGQDWKMFVDIWNRVL